MFEKGKTIGCLSNSKQEHGYVFFALLVKDFRLDEIA